MSEFQDKLDSLKTHFFSVSDIVQKGLPFSEVIMFGAGARGRCLKDYFTSLGCVVPFFVDNNASKQGTSIDGIPVLSLQEARLQCPSLPVFIASKHIMPIAQQIIKSNTTNFYAMPTLSFYFSPDIIRLHKKELEAVFSLLTDDTSKNVFISIVKAYLCGDDGFYVVSPYAQYLHPAVGPTDDDIIIDGGAFNGDTNIMYRKQAQVKHIVSCEPSENSFKKLISNTEAHKTSSTYIQKALWFEETELVFSDNPSSPEGNSVSETGTHKICSTTVDDIVHNTGLPQVNLIKLDVEGSEMEALLGSSETINKYHPKLQVCLYHSIEDLWKIPLFIEEKFPGYLMYMGHHSLDPHETVLYALYGE